VEVDRGGQQGGEDSGDKMVGAGRPTGAGGILPRHLLERSGRGRETADGREAIPHHSL